MMQLQSLFERMCLYGTTQKLNVLSACGTLLLTILSAIKSMVSIKRLSYVRKPNVEIITFLTQFPVQYSTSIYEPPELFSEVWQKSLLISFQLGFR